MTMLENFVVIREMKRSNNINKALS